MNTLTHYITINNKKYTYTLFKKTDETYVVTCDAAKIDQEFLNEDVPDLLNDLPALIIAEKEHMSAQNTVIRFRVTSDDKKLIEKKAIEKGYKSVSSYLRDLACE